MYVPAKLATIALAAALALGVTGSAASASLVPAETDRVAPERGGHDARILAMFSVLLDRLVAGGTLTADQKDRILAAVRAAGEKEKQAHERAPQGKLGGTMELAVEYLGLPADDVRAALRAGSSLGALADATAERSRDEMIAFIGDALTARLDQAVSEGRLTEDRAAAMKADLGERVTAFVDSVHPDLKEQRHRAKERVEQLRDRAKELRERAKQRWSYRRGVDR